MEHDRTVVFDLGRVLVPSTGGRPALASLAATAGADLDGFAAAYWPGRLGYDLGGDGTAYWSEVLAALDIVADPALIAALRDTDAGRWSALPPASADLIDGLVATGARLAVLSNAPAPLAAAVRAARWSDAFAVLVFSADLKLTKPDPAIFAAADLAYGTAPADVVFFDDKPENVAAARAHGWDAHVWTGPDAALTVLAA